MGAQEDVVVQTRKLGDEVTRCAERSHSQMKDVGLGGDYRWSTAYSAFSLVGDGAIWGA
jgi:hypothetical protein